MMLRLGADFKLDHYHGLPPLTHPGVTPRLGVFHKNL